MRRTLPWTLLIGLLAAACAREHGDAPAGTFAPGGAIDQRGNAATSRALDAPPPGGADATPDVPGYQPPAGGPGAYAEVERSELARLYDRQDAGSIDSGVADAAVRGRIASVGEDQVRIVPERGAPVTLGLEEGAQVTLGGTLVSTGDLRQGAEVRATFRTDGGGRAIANEITVLRTPGEGRGMWQEELEPPGNAPAQQQPGTPAPQQR